MCHAIDLTKNAAQYDNVQHNFTVCCLQLTIAMEQNHLAELHHVLTEARLMRQSSDLPKIAPHYYDNAQHNGLQKGNALFCTNAERHTR